MPRIGSPSFRELDRRVWQMAFARAVNTMGLSLAMTFLGIYVVETRGYPAWELGLVFLAANLAQSVVNAWAGNLSDRIGRRPLITGSLLVRSVFIAALGTQIMFDAPLWSLALNMVITSALRGCFEPVAYALVADVCTPSQRIDAFGLQRMGTNLGWAVGPALGGTLTLLIPYGAVFYVAGAGMIIAALVTMRVADPVRTRSEPRSGELRAALAGSWQSPRMRLLLVGTFLSALLQTQMFSTFSIFTTAGLGLGKEDVGLLYTINGVFVLALQIPAVAAVRRFGLAAALPWSSLVNGAGFLFVGIATGFPGAALAMIAITVGEVLFAPAHQTAIAEIADPVQRGRAYGVVGFAQMLGIAIAPFIGGVLFDALGHHHATMWALIASIGIAQALCFSAFVRKG